MKQKFFSLLALALFLALGNSAFAQKGTTGGLGGGASTGVGMGSFHFAPGGLTEGSFTIDRTAPTATTKFIGMGSVGCEGHVFLPDGVADLSKASYVVFRCDDGSGQSKITLADASASKPGIQVKVNGADATLTRD